MRRPDFIKAFSAAVALPLMARAQGARKVYRIGLAPGTAAIIFAVGSWLTHRRSPRGVLVNKEADHDRNILFTHPAQPPCRVSRNWCR